MRGKGKLLQYAPKIMERLALECEMARIEAAPSRGEAAISSYKGIHAHSLTKETVAPFSTKGSKP